MIKHRINNIQLKFFLLILSLFMLFPPVFSAENGDQFKKYLRYKSLCNYEQALDVLEEWTASLDDPVEIETNLFRIDELIKYPEQIDKALGIYNRILKNETVGKSRIMRDRAGIFVNRLLLRKGMIDEALENLKSLDFLPGFRITGPFAIVESYSDSIFPLNEFDDRGNYKGKKKQAESFDCSIDLMGSINMRDFFPDVENAVFYLRNEFSVHKSGEYIFSLGKTGYTDVWIDGRNIFTNRKSHGFCHDQYRVRLFIPQGSHDLLVRIGDCGGEIITSIRVTRAEDVIKEENGGFGPGIRLLSSSYFNALDSLIIRPEQYKNFEFNTGYLFRASGLDSIEDKESLNYFDRALKGGIFPSESCYYTGMLERDDSIKDLYFYRSAISVNIESLMEIARIKIRNKFFHEAFNVIESIEKINPLSVESKILRAELFGAMGWTPEVIKAASLIKKTKYPLNGYLIESGIAMASGEYAKAYKGYAKMFEGDCYNFNAIKLLIESLRKAGRNEEAGDMTVKAIRFYPNNIWLRLNLADIKKNSVGPEPSLPFLLTAKRLSPYNTDVLLKLGLAYYSTGRIDTGVYYLRKALTAYPDNTELKDYLLFILNKDKNSELPINSIAEMFDNISSRPDTGDFTGLENELFREFYLGNLKELYESIERLIFAHPLDPRSLLYYYDLASLVDIAGQTRVEQAFRKLAGIIEKEEFDRKNIYLLTLKLEFEKLLYRFNRGEAEKISAELSPVRRWALIGPFVKYGLSDLDYPFIPEISINLNANPGTRDINLANLSGEMDMRRFLYPETGVAYAVSTLTVDRPVKIRIYSRDPYKLFINGKETIRNIRQEVFRRCRVLRVWNTDSVTLMIKFQKADSKFRVILTDDNDRVMDFVPSAVNMAFSNFESMEVMDYPFSQFAGEAIENPGDSFFRLACYYNELGSTEAVEFYMKALELKENPVIQYLLAAFMLDYGDAKNTFFAQKGAEIIDRLAEKHPGFVPAQHRRFRKLVEERNFMRGITQGYDLFQGCENYLPLGLDIALLMSSLGYEREFNGVIDKLAKGMSGDVITQQMLALHNEETNSGESIKLYSKTLERENSDISIAGLVKLYREHGKYSEAVDIIERYDYNGNFKKELIGLLIESGDLEKATKLLFEEKVLKDDPDYDYKLGRISIAEGIDPSMYWKRMLYIAPSRPEKDYLNYIEHGKINYFSESETDSAAVINSWLSDKNIQSPLKAVRSMIFELYSDGGSRLYCDDVCFMDDISGGEYKAPLSGRIEPVSIRAYSRDGKFRDIYSLDYMDGKAVIPLSQRGNEAIHISYIIDNPVQNPAGSGFFFIPFIPVKLVNNSSVSLKVIAPEKEKVNLYFKDPDVEVITRAKDGRTEYSAVLDYSPEKPGSETGRVNENVFAFSTMSGVKDIVAWYRGLLTGAYNLELGSLRERFAGDSIIDVAGKVYNYILQNIMPEGKSLFRPALAEYTLFRGKGSAEDRVILAKSILSELGIKSYIALIGMDGLIINDSFVSPEIFAGILLYIPLDSGSGIWMDFSASNNLFGSVSESLAGRNAVIMLRDGFEIKKM